MFKKLAFTGLLSAVLLSGVFQLATAATTCAGCQPEWDECQMTHPDVSWCDRMYDRCVHTYCGVDP